MLDTLTKLINRDNQLIYVSYALFDGDPRFITAIELQFTSFSAVFRAVPDDDTLSVKIGSLEPDSDESLIDAGSYEPWSLCRGSHIVWGWRLTNQQGYDDGVRIEFSNPEEKLSFVVEFIVVASEIQIFSVNRGNTISHLT
jgi:hypothetical protein